LSEHERRNGQSTGSKGLELGSPPNLDAFDSGGWWAATSGQQIMKKKIRYSTIPISIAQSFVLLAFFLWVHAIQMMRECPTEPDLLHTVPFNNHGILHYLSHKELFAQRAAIGIALTGGAIHSDESSAS
jgi:hypothetical protein